MRLSYDPRRNLAHIPLLPSGAWGEPVRISDEININLAFDGTVAGIELLNANAQVQGDGGRLVVALEAAGREESLSLDAA